MNSDYPGIVGKSILIADDEEFIRRHIAQTLKKKGMTVIEGAAGKDVLNNLDPVPDIILMDVTMPGLDGFEVTRKIRENPQYDAIPIILLSARAQFNDIDAGKKAGATDYLVKPVTISQILEKLSEHLSP